MDLLSEAVQAEIKRAKDTLERNAEHTGVPDTGQKESFKVTCLQE